MICSGRTKYKNGGTIMNKRWNSRKPVQLDLVINYPAIGLLRGKASNISHDGMFIETAVASLSHYSDIEITLNMPSLSEFPIQIPAIVIHNSGKGIGIMFRNSPSEHKNTLANGMGVIQQLLNQQQENPQKWAC